LDLSKNSLTFFESVPYSKSDIFLSLPKTPQKEVITLFLVVILIYSSRYF
jgi:hypothetical protein